MRVTIAAVVLLFSVAGVTSRALEDKLEAVPYDTVISGMGRFVYNAVAANWTNAHRNCMTTFDGGDLAYPESEEEARVLLSLMETAGSTTIHLGFHDQFEEGKYITIRDEPLRKLGYHTWATSEPTGGVSYNCGGLLRSTSQSGLTDVTCATVYPYICKYKLWDDYELIPGHGNYKMYTTSRTWSAAKEQCRLDGASLLVLNSVAEKDAVVAKFGAMVGSEGAWYGVHQKFAFHNFISIFNEPLEETGYSAWYPGFPNALDNTLYPYVSIFLSGSNSGTLRAMWASTSTLPFICKHGLHDHK